MTVTQLRDDPTFREHFPPVYKQLKEYALGLQRRVASECKDDLDEAGRRVLIVAELLEDFDAMLEVNAPKQATRPKLRNRGERG